MRLPLYGILVLHEKEKERIIYDGRQHTKEGANPRNDSRSM